MGVKKFALASIFFLLAVSSLPAQGNPVLTVRDLIAGKTTTLDVNNGNAGDLVLVAYSLTGPCPTSTPLGTVALSPPIQKFPTLTADATGLASLQKTVPNGTASLAVWFHAANVTSGLLSNNLALVVDSWPSANMVPVPAGSFVMGDHAGVGNGDEFPLHSVSLDGFSMDVVDLTNQRYADYLNSAYSQGDLFVSNNVVTQSGGAAMALADTTSSSAWTRIRWDGVSFGVTANFENHPVVQISWSEACLYANWRSRENALTPCYDETTWSCDWFDPTYYGKSASTNPIGPINGTDRVFRGGGWWHSADHLRSADRNCNDPVGRYAGIGLRLVQ